MAEEHRRLVWQISRNGLVRKILSDRFFDGIGLQRGRFPMLQVLLHNEGCTQIEVAEQLRISPASVAVTLRRMERDGLVQRREDTQDQRCKRIYATEKAKEIAARSRDFFDSLDEKMFEGLSDEEMETLSRLLDRLFDNLAGDEFRDLNPCTAFLYDQQKEKMEETDD